MQHVSHNNGDGATSSFFDFNYDVSSSIFTQVLSLELGMHVFNASSKFCDAVIKSSSH